MDKSKTDWDWEQFYKYVQTGKITVSVLYRAGWSAACVQIREHRDGAVIGGVETISVVDNK